MARTDFAHIRQELHAVKEVQRQQLLTTLQQQNQQKKDAALLRSLSKELSEQKAMISQGVSREKKTVQILMN